MSESSPNVVWHVGLGRDDRWRLLKSRGGTVWLTGLSGSGKSTIAVQLERLLVQRGVHAYRLDGDNVRHGLCSDLGFSEADRDENIRRVGEVCRLFADAGNVVVASFISPTIATRARVREMHERDGLPFFEVFVDTPLEVCERRDPKGLYARARAGEIPHFTGISAPYEPPPRPELVLQAERDSVESCVFQVLALLSERGLF